VPSENIEQRKLAAIMFTDMVGYSALSQRDDRLALELLEELRALGAKARKRIRRGARPINRQRKRNSCVSDCRGLRVSR
jgi:hypothetical protein